MEVDNFRCLKIDEPLTMSVYHLFLPALDSRGPCSPNEMIGIAGRTNGLFTQTVPIPFPIIFASATVVFGGGGQSRQKSQC
jgi:hypothetical protein